MGRLRRASLWRRSRPTVSNSRARLSQPSRSSSRHPVCTQSSPPALVRAAAATATSLRVRSSLSTSVLSGSRKFLPERRQGYGSSSTGSVVLFAALYSSHGVSYVTRYQSSEDKSRLISIARHSIQLITPFFFLFK